jgi:hypothetical protein
MCGQVEQFIVGNLQTMIKKHFVYPVFFKQKTGSAL